MLSESTKKLILDLLYTHDCSLSDLCANNPDIPDILQLMKFVSTMPDFRAAVEEIEKGRAMRHEREAIEIADSDYTDIHRDKLKVDTRLKVASHLRKSNKQKTTEDESTGLSEDALALASEIVDKYKRDY